MEVKMSSLLTFCFSTTPNTMGLLWQSCLTHDLLLEPVQLESLWSDVIQWLCVQGQTYSQVRMKNISFQNLSPFSRQLISVMILLAFHLDSIWAQSTLVIQLHVLLVYLQMGFMLQKIQVFLLMMYIDVYESALWGFVLLELPEIWAEVTQFHQPKVLPFLRLDVLCFFLRWTVACL